MGLVEQALETQLKNIQQRTGKTLDELYTLIRASGLTRHGEIRDMLKRDLGLGFGDATILAQFYLKSLEPVAIPPGADPIELAVEELYAGSKASLRPIHDALMVAIEPFGPFEIAPKKGYLSLRRKRQFAMLGPASKGRFGLGLNMKDIPPTERLTELPPGGMCQYMVFLTQPAEVDAELTAWLKLAYDRAG